VTHPSRWGLLDPTHEQGAAVSDDAVLAAMIEVEAALLTASAERRGVDGTAGADAIRSARPDAAALAAGTARDGLPVPELVRGLREAVATRDPDAVALVHDGATSQDVVDTALVLVARRALADTRDGLVAAGHALARIALAEARTPVVARTLAQAAAPSTFGAQIATWVDGIASAIHAVDAARFPVQLGGAVGVGGADRSRLAALLGLDDPGRVWHVERTPVLAIGQAAATVVAALAHVGRDLVQLVRPELGFVALPGGGGSSAMPHKRNPIDAVVLVTSGARAPGALATLHAAAIPVDARPAGEWHAEWPALRELLGLAAASSAAASRLAAGLRVDRDAIARDTAALSELIGPVTAPDGASTAVDAAIARFAAAAAGGAGTRSPGAGSGPGSPAPGRIAAPSAPDPADAGGASS
jgi:3-carboxy-cis,cis-muconate cycloisomerase